MARKLNCSCLDLVGMNEIMRGGREYTSGKIHYGAYHNKGSGAGRNTAVAGSMSKPLWPRWHSEATGDVSVWGQLRETYWWGEGLGCFLLVTSHSHGHV